MLAETQSDDDDNDEFFLRIGNPMKGVNRSSHQRYSVTIDVPRNFAKFTGKQHLRQSLFLIKLQATLAQVFSCEFCEISKNNFFDRPHAVAAPSIKPYFQRGPLTEILTITNLRPQTG